MSVYLSSQSIPRATPCRISVSRGFTLIELLIVSAIIGILAGILIPVVGYVQERAKIAAGKVQLSGYVNAINMFKGEYNFYPLTDLAGDDEKLDLSEYSEEFIETLSARSVDDDGTKTSGHNNANRRQISFYDFSENDYLEGDASTAQIADRFNNTNIYILIDADGDGRIEDVPDPAEPTSTTDVQTKVSAYVEASDGAPDYYLYE